jgi:hypothetical protein
MGYLTTVTIYNDGLSLLKQHPEEFCTKLYEAASSMEPKEFGVDYFCNFANVQRTRHADDHTLYVHMGNTVVEVNAWSTNFQRMMETRPELADSYIQFIELSLNDMKCKRQELRDANAPNPTTAEQD